MKAATLNEIKKELKEMAAPELLELCLRMAKYKKDNKELLSYLIFESNDEKSYVQNLKEDLEIQFIDANMESLYYAKKSLRRILKNLKSQIKYSGNKQTEAELLLHFCRLLKGIDYRYNEYVALLNMYEAQMKRARIAIKSLHEDLQYDLGLLVKEVNDLR